MDNIEPSGNISLLNLPEPILDCILKRLLPNDLINMSQVCTYFCKRCRSDPLWEDHIKQKWGKVIGDVVYKEWQWHLTKAKEGANLFNQHINNQNGSLGSFSGTWPVLYLGSYLEDSKHLNSSLSNNFMMTLYFSIENGKFWFPAQTYRGVLVRYALVRYDSKTDSFQARQQYGGWQAMGNNIQWDCLRATPVDTPPSVRYISDCLKDLKPGDHIEIQWKLREETPYDWWYAVIGHMDSCDENENHCRCCYSETLIVEVKQYSQGSRRGRIKLLKNGECEDSTGYYGGIRKLHSEEEIERWKKLLLLHQTPMRRICHLPRRVRRVAR